MICWSHPHGRKWTTSFRQTWLSRAVLRWQVLQRLWRFFAQLFSHEQQPFLLWPQSLLWQPWLNSQRAPAKRPEKSEKSDIRAIRPSQFQKLKEGFVPLASGTCGEKRTDTKASGKCGSCNLQGGSQSALGAFTSQVCGQTLREQHLEHQRLMLLSIKLHSGCCTDLLFSLSLEQFCHTCQAQPVYVEVSGLLCL